MPSKPHKYSIKGVDYNFPSFWNEKIMSSKEIVGVLEHYPAHTSARSMARSEIALCDNGKRITVINEENTKLPNLVAKPRFLQFLENYIKEEIIKRKCSEVGACVERLNIYRQVFSWLIEAFRTYKPILQLVKVEFDCMLDYYLTETNKLNPKRKVLYELAITCDENVRHYEKETNFDLIKLKYQNAALTNRKHHLLEDNARLNNEIAQQKQLLTESHIKYIDIADARRVLQRDISITRNTNELANRLNRCNSVPDIPGRTENLKIIIEALKKTTEEVEHELNEAKERLKNGVSANIFEDLEQQYMKLNVANGELHHSIELTLAKTQNLQHKFIKCQEERDHYYLKEMEYTDPKKHSPNYERILTAILGLSKIKRLKPVHAIEKLQYHLCKNKVPTKLGDNMEEHSHTPSMNIPQASIPKNTAALHMSPIEVCKEIDHHLGFYNRFFEKKMIDFQSNAGKSSLMGIR